MWPSSADALSRRGTDDRRGAPGRLRTAYRTVLRSQPLAGNRPSWVHVPLQPVSSCGQRAGRGRRRRVRRRPSARRPVGEQRVSTGARCRSRSRPRVHDLGASAGGGRPLEHARQRRSRARPASRPSTSACSSGSGVTGRRPRRGRLSARASREPVELGPAMPADARGPRCRRGCPTRIAVVARPVGRRRPARRRRGPRRRRRSIRRDGSARCRRRRPRPRGSRPYAASPQRLQLVGARSALRPRSPGAVGDALELCDVRRPSSGDSPAVVHRSPCRLPSASPRRRVSHGRPVDDGGSSCEARRHLERPSVVPAAAIAGARRGARCDAGIVAASRHRLRPVDRETPSGVGGEQPHGPGRTSRRARPPAVGGRVGRSNTGEQVGLVERRPVADDHAPSRRVAARVAGDRPPRRRAPTTADRAPADLPARRATPSASATAPAAMRPACRGHPPRACARRPMRRDAIAPVALATHGAGPVAAAAPRHPPARPPPRRVAAARVAAPRARRAPRSARSRSPRPRRRSAAVAASAHRGRVRPRRPPSVRPAGESRVCNRMPHAGSVEQPLSRAHCSLDARRRA